MGRERYSFTYTATDGVLTMDIAERNTKTTARYTMSDGKLTMTEVVRSSECNISTKTNKLPSVSRA